jgi:TonB family protein
MCPPFSAASRAWFAILLVTLLASTTRSQDAPAGSTSTPTDPAALMLVAAKLNTLTAGDLKPWHLKATYQTFDEKGNVADEGTLEESWVAPDKFKRTYSGKVYTQTDFGTGSGVLRSGQRDDVSHLLLDLRRDLVDPLPDAQALGIGPFTEKQVDSGGSSLRCLTLAKPAGTPTYCLAADQPMLRNMLRITSWPGDGTHVLRNRMVSFHDHYLASDLSVVRAGKTILSAHLASIETLDPVNDADLSPTSDAIALPRRIHISAGVAQGLLERKVAPEYPSDARAQRAQGTIVLQALIGTDGRVKDLRAISGPPVLQKSAIDAVSRWRYRPYLLSGSPVEVMTTINVIISVG